MGSRDNEGMKPASFASMFKDNTSKKTVHLSELRNDECVSGADVSIPMTFVDEFATKEGMEQVFENGPWLIWLVPIILNTWTLNTRLKKDEINTAPVWIKLHNVPIVAFSEVELSLITTKLGCPIMLDAYT
ncbi:zinc knuckle CX2CX4HX4C containing protein, partial [Tanacetum coccineum]